MCRVNSDRSGATNAGRPNDEDTANDGGWWLALEEGDGTKAKVELVAPAERTAAIERAETLNFIISLLPGLGLFRRVLLSYY